MSKSEMADSTSGTGLGKGSEPRLLYPKSGLLECSASVRWAELVHKAEETGWSVDGFHSEPRDATVGQLIERVQPRPIHWGCGLLASQCRSIAVDRGEQGEYLAAVSPRKASGPDLAFLFIGGQGQFGRVQRVVISLHRPAPSYLSARGSYSDLASLFAASRAIALLEPLSLRRFGADNELQVYCPVRSAGSHQLEERLAELGLEVEPCKAVPREQRYLEQDQSSGVTLTLSGNYQLMEERIGSLQELAGRKRLEIGFSYPDTHGLVVRLTMAAANRELLQDFAFKCSDLNGIYYCGLEQEEELGIRWLN